MSKRRIYFDTETTGLHPGVGEGDEIITLSIVDESGDVLHDAIYKPRWNSEWPEAESIHGISPADVADLPTIEGDLPKIAEIFERADEVCGYNVGFDLRFLAALGIRPRENAEIIDTMQLYAPIHGDWNDCYEDFKWCKLTVAADEIGYEWTGSAHGSLADTLATKAVQEWIENRAR
ncbi:3'-5' exonuclease [Collinsella intestinalis]|uniref:3'-5' exonuclease n=1 Tax=Collinsella intestinalis TaxID=147207 RepID=UPI0026712315|nr:3'-5' exonuclease [Collinsella intestinalis]